MKQTARIISTYSADVMGVCSALFELGGMTIMHDASGCNSTYTTHDEPRWYDMDSMVYISGLSEIEAIMGDDEKLIGDICDTAGELHPAFIAIAGTPIPAMTGFDYEAVAEVVEMRTGIPSLGVPTTGMNTYIHGASMALAGIAARMIDDPAPDDLALPLGMIKKSADGSRPELLSRIRVNILGLTPLDFSVNGTDESLAQWLEDCGFEIESRWAMGSSLDELRNAGRADVNLVVTAAGFGAAEVIYERLGIPYVAGLPIGNKQSGMLKTALENAALRSRALRYSVRKSGDESDVEVMRSTDHDGNENSAPAGRFRIQEYGGNVQITGKVDYHISRNTSGNGASGKKNSNIAAEDAPKAQDSDGDKITGCDSEETHSYSKGITKDAPRNEAGGYIAIIGEGVTSIALATAIELETGLSTRVLCATECPEGILRENDLMTPDEDDIIPELENADVIIADPMYRPICPVGAKFIELPSEAFSGRIYRDAIPDLIKGPEYILKHL